VVAARVCVVNGVRMCATVSVRSKWAAAHTKCCSPHRRFPQESPGWSHRVRRLHDCEFSNIPGQHPRCHLDMYKPWLSVSNALLHMSHAS
jgi:hypothetical protein